MTAAYWTQRAKEERAWINQNLKNDAEFNKHLQQYYDRALTDIDKTIDAEYSKFQDPEAARKAVSQMDVQAYQATAKDIVKKADEMRKAGKAVTYDDFSDEVNARLKVYNATMRINRLENIKSQIGAQMLSAHLDVQSAISDKLTADYQAEIKRQAGIMGETTKSKLWTSKDVAKTVMAQTAGANFSHRIWANQDALKAELDGIISAGVMRGESPRKMATNIKAQVKDSVTNHRYVTERVARTESSRVQYKAQIDSIKKNGYQFVQWFAEPKACATCKAIARENNGFGEGIYKVDKVPKIPEDTHPNCRCAISETWVDGQRNLTLTDEEQLDKSKQGKPVKDSDGLTDKEAVKRFLNDGIVDKIGDKKAVELARKIENSPKYMRKVWGKYSDKVALKQYSESAKGSYCSGKEVIINTKNMNLTDDANWYQKKNDVFFHEFGHAIDLASANRTKVVRSSDVLTDSLAKDWDNLVEPNIVNVTNVELSQIKDGLGELKNEPGHWVKLKKDGTPTKAEMNRLNKFARYDAEVKTIAQIQEATKGISKQAKGDLSDVISGRAYDINDFPLGVGHSSTYWGSGKKYNVPYQPTEFFAESTSATINNPESLKLLQKYFPISSAKYKEILEEIGK